MKAARRIFLAIAILSAMACSDGGSSGDAGLDGAQDSATTNDGQVHDAASGDGGVDDDGDVEDGGVEDDGDVDDGGLSDDGGPTVMCPDGGTADPATATEMCTAYCNGFVTVCVPPAAPNCVADCVSGAPAWTAERLGRMLECLDVSTTEECLSAAECSATVSACP